MGHNEERRQPRPRRKFSDEFKRDAVDLVLPPDGRSRRSPQSSGCMTPRSGTGACADIGISTTKNATSSPTCPRLQRPLIQRKLRAAWANPHADTALRELQALARALDKKRPGAAASLREGLEGTLTVNRLGVTGNLFKALESTNPAESMIEVVRHHARRVKHWQHGEMALRWTAAGML